MIVEALDREDPRLIEYMKDALNDEEKNKNTKI